MRLKPAHTVARLTTPTAQPIKNDLITFNPAVIENATLGTVQTLKLDDDGNDLGHGKVILLVLAGVCAVRHSRNPCVSGVTDVVQGETVTNVVTMLPCI